MTFNSTCKLSGKYVRMRLREVICFKKKLYAPREVYFNDKTLKLRELIQKTIESHGKGYFIYSEV